MTFVDFIPAIIFVMLGLAVGVGVLLAASRLVRKISPDQRRKGPDA